MGLMVRGTSTRFSGDIVVWLLHHLPALSAGCGAATLGGLHQPRAGALHRPPSPPAWSCAAGSSPRRSDDTAARSVARRRQQGECAVVAAAAGAAPCTAGCGQLPGHACRAQGAGSVHSQVFGSQRSAERQRGREQAERGAAQAPQGGCALGML